MIAFAYLIEPPFNFRAADGSVTGCDVELARKVLGMLGLEADFVETEFANLLPGLADGRWRMTTGLFATEERRRLVAFSRPIWALPDGLLVAAGNPLQLDGYRAIGRQKRSILAVVDGQVQHRSALDLGVPADRLLACRTYEAAAQAVSTGQAHAFASVARAHAAFVARAGAAAFDVVQVPPVEKQAAFGCFGIGKGDTALLREVDRALGAYLGTSDHRALLARFGFADAEIGLNCS